jgi:hypothetical protein
MAIKDWVSVYPTGGIDTNTEQPTIIQFTDNTRASQINSMRDAIQALEEEVGSDLIESGSLRFSTQELEATASNLQASVTNLEASRSFTDLDDVPSSYAGSDGYLVKVSGSQLVFTSSADLGGGTTSPLTNKGDIYTYDTDNQRLGTGSDGQVLTVDSAEPAGLKWANVSGSGGGSVPIEDDGVQIVASPTAINFTGSGVAVTDVGGVATVEVPGVGDALPTAGAVVDMFVGTPASTQAISSTTFADVPGSSLPEQQFTVDVGGTYDLDVLLQSLSTSTANGQAAAFYQLVIDEGDFNGFPEQIIGSRAGATKEWWVFTDNGGNTSWEFKSVTSEVTLAVGTHKCKFKARKDTDYANSPRLAANGAFVVKGVLRAATQLPVVGAAVNLYAGVYAGGTVTLSNTSFTDISTLSGTFSVDVAGTYDISAILSSLSSTNSNELSEVEYRLVVDDGGFGGFTEQTIGADAVATKSWSVLSDFEASRSEWVHHTTFASASLGAGTHSVKIQYKKNQGNPRLSSGGEGYFLVKGVLRAANQAELSNKGELLTYSTASAVLPSGSDGQVLVADSSESTGLRWGSPSPTAYSASLAANETVNWTSIGPFQTNPVDINFTTTKDNEVVWVSYGTSWSSLTSNQLIYFQVALDGGAIDKIHRQELSAGALSFSFPLIVPTAGAHTGSLYVRVSGGSASVLGPSYTFLHILQF